MPPVFAMSRVLRDQGRQLASKHGFNQTVGMGDVIVSPIFGPLGGLDSRPAAQLSLAFPTDPQVLRAKRSGKSIWPLNANRNRLITNGFLLGSANQPEMTNYFRSPFDKLIQLLLCSSWIKRWASFVAYQLKRSIRRNAESRLRSMGLYGDIVMLGPFAGMRYPSPEQWASHRFEKIIGAYEHELHPLLSRLASTKQYDLVVNVGAAEGFYTCGLARLFPSAQIISYESNPDWAPFCQELCRLNQVLDRVDARGNASLEILTGLDARGQIFVWMDAETEERQLLDPTKVSWLQQAEILVELHDCFEPGLRELIMQRFAPTHRIEQFTSAGLDYARYPVLRGLLFTEIDALVGEDRRGIQDWLYMEPLKAARSPG